METTPKKTNFTSNRVWSITKSTDEGEPIEVFPLQTDINFTSETVHGGKTFAIR